MRKPFVSTLFYNQIARSVQNHSDGRLHYRQELHLARKVWHMSMGLLMAATYASGVPRSFCVLFLGSAFVLALVVEISRLRIPTLNEVAIKFWGPLMRSHEVYRLSGTPFYLGSAVAAIWIFPKPIAVLSILYLAFGDPFASLFGILYGSKGPRFKNGKSLIGTLAGVGVCLVVGLLYLQTIDLPIFSYFFLSVCGALAGGLAEQLPIEIDDNFLIPVVSGFSLWFFWILFQLPIF